MQTPPTQSTEPSANVDPLLGVQRQTDSATEAQRAPGEEVTLSEQPEGAPRRSRLVAGVLGLLLGGLGAHRFYLEYRRLGYVQLAFTSSTFVLALILARMSGATWSNTLLIAVGVAMLGVMWGVVEGLSILMGMLRHDAHGRPLTSD